MSSVRSRRAVHALPLACAACLALSACGGSSKQAAGPQDSFTRQADAICVAGAARMSALPAAAGVAQEAAVARRGSAVIARYLARLERLKPPPAKAGEFNVYLASLRREIDNEDAIAAAARAHDTTSLKSLKAGRVTYVKHSHDLGRKLGLTRCYR